MDEIQTLKKRIAELEMQSMFLRSTAVRGYKLPPELTAATLREHVKPLDGMPGFEVLGQFGERIAKLGSADDLQGFDQAITQLVKSHPRGQMITNGSGQSIAEQKGGAAAGTSAAPSGQANQSAPKGSMRRADWEAMPHLEKAHFIRSGGRVHD